MLNNSISQSKKRIPWSQLEDDLLQQFVNMYANQKQGWNEISLLLKKEGYERSPKDCRERFQNYLDLKFNKTKLTKFEIDRLFELIMIYGNKWTCIAEKLNNRTDQDVKNQFYALVKKVFRRLLKATLSEDQKNNCSKITASLRPMLISNIFCNNQNNAQKYINISTNMKELFKSLIIENRQIKFGDQLDETVKKKVEQISNYLGKKNQLYLQNKNQRRSLNQRNHIKQTRDNELKSSCNQVQQQKIIQRILNHQQIFNLNNQKLPIKFDINQEKEFIEKKDFIQNSYFNEESCAPQYISSRPPFYQLSSSNKFNSIYSHRLEYQEYSYYEPYQDTNNLNTSWN